MSRILVIDDDDQIRRALVTTLTRGGFQVDSADDGAPAIAMSDHHYAVVLVDFNMKTTSGPEVVRHYKERYGTAVYCAILSGEDGESARLECLEAGADDVFVKPTSPLVLRKRLREVLDSMQQTAA